MRAALYARVSTADQEPANQLDELRRYVSARGWHPTEYTECPQRGQGSASRPGSMLKDCQQRRVDILVVWRLDRWGRSLRHLVTLIDELQAWGVSFISLGEGIDLGTPAGRLQLHILNALSEFERARIAERVKAGMARAKRQGKKLGGPEKRVPETLLAPLRSLPVREAVKRLGVSPTTAHRWLGRRRSRASL